MEYLYEAPTILEVYKSNFLAGKNELAYENFLLQRLPAINPENGELISYKVKNICLEENNQGNNYRCEYRRYNIYFTYKR